MNNRTELLWLFLSNLPDGVQLSKGWCPVEEITCRTDFTFDELEDLAIADLDKRIEFLYWEMGGDGLPYTKCLSDIRIKKNP